MFGIERDARKKSSVEQSGELRPTNVVNKVLILGSRISGAYELGSGFQAYLEAKEVPSPVVEVLRDAGLIEAALLGREELAQGRVDPLLPRGVILLPQMRQYYGGMGMTLDTYTSGVAERVRQLCLKYNVPLVEIRQYISPEQITAGIKQLLLGE